MPSASDQPTLTHRCAALAIAVPISQEYIRAGIADDLRADGRACSDYRPFTCETVSRRIRLDPRTFPTLNPRRRRAYASTQFCSAHTRQSRLQPNPAVSCRLFGSRLRTADIGVAAA